MSKLINMLESATNVSDIKTIVSQIEDVESLQEIVQYYAVNFLEIKALIRRMTA